MEYIKEDDKIYKVTTIKEPVDLDALKAELTEIKSEEEPTDEELIEMGKSFHPYYNRKTNELEDKIVKIEKDIN